MAIPLFEHLAEVSGEIEAAPHLLLGVDFDGTLAPIVPRGEDAQMPAETRSALESLTSRPDITVAVISGRKLSDLAARTPLNVILAGNHGLEIRGNGFDFHHPQAAAWQGALHRTCEELRVRVADIAGAVVEDKGLTATVHFRNVAEEVERQKLAEIVRSAVAPDLDKFELRNGRKTIEVLPRVDWNKGSAMLWLRDHVEPRGSSLICYIGDDGTDEDVFRVSDGITIHVGSRPTAARFTVKDPREVIVFLQWLSRGK